MVSIGDIAPDFTLVNQEMNPVSLSSFKGQTVVLAFYPGAFTGVCKAEMCSIRDGIAKLEDLNAVILGISVNDPFANKAFHEDNVLNFDLLCDFNRDVVKLYNVYHENFAGLKGYTAAKRSVFIVGDDEKVKFKWVTEDPGVLPDFDTLEQELTKLS